MCDQTCLVSTDTHRWQQRTLSSDGKFVFPYLQPGMRVVDIGCGPGSITLDLSEVVSPGRVIGIDCDVIRLRIARQAVVQGQGKTHFIAGDATALPLNPASVDLIFTNGLLEHLVDPDRALHEFKRILVPGGIIALRSPDWGTAILTPEDPRLHQSIALRNRWQRYNGGNPEMGRHLRSCLMTAGFHAVEAGATAEACGSIAHVQDHRDYMLRLLTDPQLADLCHDYHWATATDLISMAEAWTEWARAPGAFAAFFWCYAIGIQPD